MALYLVQHGKNEPKSVDPQKGLSPEGRQEVARIGEVAAGYGVRVDRIVHSGMRRAAQTAEILAQYLKPSRGAAFMEGIKPLDDVVPVADGFAWDVNIMIVGHLPFLERLVSHLILGSDRPVFRLQNGGILCLERETETGAVVILWSLMPNIG
jgi:phosphohistidine phosphatase